MSTETKLRSGLSETTSVGACGRYRPFVSHQQVRLATAVWRNGRSTQADKEQGELFDLELPESYSVHTSNQSWTGKTVAYAWPGGGVEVELRGTLPGVMISPVGRDLHLRWGGNPPMTIELLDHEKGSWPRAGVTDGGLHRFFIVHGKTARTLVVLSKPLARIDVYSHGNWHMQFRDTGVKLFLVPLLPRQTSVASTPVEQSAWDALLTNPPTRCEESYHVETDRVHLRQHFPSARMAPICPLISLHGQASGLLRLPEQSLPLLDTFLGPYRVVTGDAWEASIELGWTRAVARPKAPAHGEMAPIPDELAYAGDWTWDPSTPMDRLLELRIWAPLLDAMPQELRRKLEARLMPPTADALRASLHTIIEPVTGIEWSKERNLFTHNGDISWDPDWYNGLTVSGIERATRATDPAIASAGRALASGCRGERARLTRYFELFHDWGLWTAWSDARGIFWLPDCGHNGMEGLLAEARLCRAEGDHPRADRMTYLAAKTAVSLMAGFELAEWCPKSGFGRTVDPTKPIFGINIVLDGNGVGPICSDTKNPYILASHFPEYASLLKSHGPMTLLRQLADTWARDFPERYRDWIGFYIGDDPAAVKAKWDALDQEARVQGAVFYHLSPEVCFRYWVLEESADSIEARYATPLNLAEQLLLRSGMTLSTPATAT